MDNKQKQEWQTPELVEYGDAARLTEVEAKVPGPGDGIVLKACDWQS